MKNVKEMHEELTRLYSQLASGEMDVKRGAEMINCAGKMINAAKVQVEYRKLQQSEKKIDFLE